MFCLAAFLALLVFATFSTSLMWFLTERVYYTICRRVIFYNPLGNFKRETEKGSIFDNIPVENVDRSFINLYRNDFPE